MTSVSAGNIITEGAVGRAIFQSSDWKKIIKRTGNAPHQIFLDETSPIEISVFHLDNASDKDLTEIGDDMATQRGINREFYGWAELSVANASENKREVHATPNPLNQWHADIVLPSIAETDKMERERHANELAQMVVHRDPKR